MGGFWTAQASNITTLEGRRNSETSDHEAIAITPLDTVSKNKN